MPFSSAPSLLTIDMARLCSQTQKEYGNTTAGLQLTFSASVCAKYCLFVFIIGIIIHSQGIGD